MQTEMSKRKLLILLGMALIAMVAALCWLLGDKKGSPKTDMATLHHTASNAIYNCQQDVAGQLKASSAQFYVSTVLIGDFDFEQPDLYVVFGTVTIESPPGNGTVNHYTWTCHARWGGSYFIGRAMLRE